LNEKSIMHRSQRLIAAAVLTALVSALGGCAGGGFDPTDLLDFLDTKKKLPGERKPVFPDGVPGLEQGVPKELYKGAAQPLEDQNAQAAAPVAPVAEEPKPKGAKSKGKSKQATVSPAPTQDPNAAADPDAASEEDGSTAAAPPAPPPKKIARRRTTAPPHDQTAGQPAQSAQSASSPFPAPLPSGPR
jgi:hypothetical protein